MMVMPAHKLGDEEEGLPLLINTEYKATGAQGPQRRSVLLQAVLLLVFMITFGVLNQISFTAMANWMPGYPAFLLYGTTFVYCLIFTGVFLVHRRRVHAEGKRIVWPNWKQALIFGVIGVAGNGVCDQFAAPYVDGNIQNALNQCLPVALIAVVSPLVLGRRFYREQIVALILTLASVLLAIIPGLMGHHAATVSDAWFWVLIFALSVLPTVVTVIQEEVLCGDPHDHDLIPADEACCGPCGRALRWPRPQERVDVQALLLVDNWLSFVVYLFSIFFEMSSTYGPSTHPDGMTFAQVLAHQIDALKCYFGIDVPALWPGDCWPGAWASVTVFILQFAGYAILTGVLVAQTSAAFQIVASAVVFPLAAVFMQISQLSGEVYTMPWNVGVSLPLAFVGLLIFSLREVAAITEHGTRLHRVLHRLLPDAVFGVKAL